MDKRSMFLGAGLGIIIVTFVFFVALKFTAKPETQIQTVTEAMSDEQVIEQARKLGMVMVKELPASSGEADGSQSVDKAEYEALKKEAQELRQQVADTHELVRINQEALKAAEEQLRASNDASQASASSNTPAQSGTQSTQAPSTQAPSTQAPSAQAPSTQAQASTAQSQQDYSAGSVVDMGDFTRITIPRGENSYTISSLLSHGGVVEDAVKFNEFVMDNGKSTVLIAGSYDIPKDATYEEVLEIITKAQEIEQ